MKYLVVSASFHDSPVREEFGETGGEYSLDFLGLNDSLLQRLKDWNDEYKKIIPLARDQRRVAATEIDELDRRGLALCQEIICERSGKVKIKYYSEGWLGMVPLLIAETRGA